MPGATTDKHAMKGMNTATTPAETIKAKSRGQITDGADLSKGYKTVHPDHTQRGAYSSHNKSSNMKHHR